MIPSGAESAPPEDEAGMAAFDCLLRGTTRHRLTRL